MSMQSILVPMEPHDGMASVLETALLLEITLGARLSELYVDLYQELQLLVLKRSEALPEDVRRKSVDVVFDSVGSMIACSQLPEVAAIVKFLRQMGGAPQCTMIGHADHMPLLPDTR